MRIFFDSRIQREIVYINAGEYHISTNNEIISTLLGSCISVCLYDRITGIGGMNHFMLPEKTENINITHIERSKLKHSNETMRYGVTAMGALISEMQNHGVKRQNITAKVFGGGKVIAQSSSSNGVGWKNIQFVRSYLKVERIPIEAENTGELVARKVSFDTTDNSVSVKHIGMDSVAKTEKEYLEKINKPLAKAKIIYF